MALLSLRHLIAVLALGSDGLSTVLRFRRDMVGLNLEILSLRSVIVKAWQVSRHREELDVDAVKVVSA